jgi:hypothetical protein
MRWAGWFEDVVELAVELVALKSEPQMTTV